MNKGDKKMDYKFTLEIFYKDKRHGLKNSKYYCGVCTIGRKVVYATSKDRNCAKKFKNMASAKGVATRLMKKHNINKNYINEIVGYEINIVEKSLV